MRRSYALLTGVLAAIVVAICVRVLGGIALGSLGVDVPWTGLRPVHAQSIDAGAAKRGGHVTFAAVSQSITANQPATVQLHFRVDSGFHINSHTPKSEILIPTRLIVDDMTGAEVTSVDFPRGTEYSFSFEPGTKLDVYTGDLTLTAHLRAKPGSYVLKGGLRYQACDNAACYPPKLLPVEQAFTAK